MKQLKADSTGFLFPNNKRLQHCPALSFIGKGCPLFCILPIQTIAYVSYQTPVKFLADH
jgi:hypothetical protein